MNGITFIRKIDDLGRIVIPKELRGKLKLSENENILLKLTDNKIEIQKLRFHLLFQLFFLPNLQR